MKRKKDINVPQEMNISVMQRIVPNNGEQFYISDDFCISRGFNFFSNFLSLNSKGPFIVEDYRIGFLVKGEIHVRVNLIDYHISPNSAIILPKGSASQILSLSDDVEAIGFIASGTLINNFIQDNDTIKFKIVELNNSEKEFYTDFINVIWKFVHLEGYPKKVLSAFLYSLMTFITSREKEEFHHSIQNHKQEIFNKFISLVNENSKKEHEISFYSDKLFLSPRYFSSLIFSQSGKHAKSWIDESLITHAKVLLKNSSKSVNQISYELNFPNDSFFCKFFKRLTGMSPTEYRNLTD